MILLFTKFILRKYLLTKALYEEISLRKKISESIVICMYITLQHFNKYLKENYFLPHLQANAY